MLQLPGGWGKPVLKVSTKRSAVSDVANALRVKGLLFFVAALRPFIMYSSSARAREQKSCGDPSRTRNLTKNACTTTTHMILALTTLAPAPQSHQKAVGSG